MEYNIYLVNSFSNETFKGNPAGVVPDAKGLNEIQMQKIARELNVSETAFIVSNDMDSYKIRYFSPYGEVDFCGHSTLATFYVLALRGYINPVESGTKTFYVISGKRKLEIEMHFYKDKVENIIVKIGTPEEIGIVNNRDEFLNYFNLKLEDINLDNKFNAIPILRFGFKYAFVPIIDKEKLDNIEIDKEGLKKKLEELEIQGVHLFSLPEKNSKYVYARNFHILNNLEEESATGTANGALLYLLKTKNLINSDNITSIQGEKMERKSKIFCHIKEVNGKEIVEISGKGKVVLEGVINLG